MSEQLILKPRNGMQIVHTKIIKWEAGKLVNKTPVLLLDVSISMAEPSGSNNGKRKIDILREVMTNYPGISKYVFSDDCSLCEYIPEPYGTTRLDSALDVVGRGRPDRIILISDGRPDYPEESMRVALTLHIPIDVIYIGEHGDHGEQFMKELALRTGGKEITITTSDLAKNLQQATETLLLSP